MAKQIRVLNIRVIFTYSFVLRQTPQFKNKYISHFFLVHDKKSTKFNWKNQNLFHFYLNFKNKDKDLSRYKIVKKFTKIFLLDKII